MDFDESYNQTQSQFITQQTGHWAWLVQALRALAIVLFVLVVVVAVLIGYVAKNGSIGESVTTAAERDVVAAQMEVSVSKKAVSTHKGNKKFESQLRAAEARLIVARAAFGEDASREADRLLVEEPENPLVLFAAAKAYEASSDRSAESSRLLQQAAEKVQPQAGELARVIYSEYASVLEKRNDLTGALKFIKQAASVTPVSVDVLYQMASIAKKHNNYYEQAVAYCRIINVSPDDTQAPDLLAQLAKVQPAAVTRAQADFPKKEVGQ